MSRSQEPSAGVQRPGCQGLVAAQKLSEHTLHTSWDTSIPYRAESVHFFGAYELSNLKTKLGVLGFRVAGHRV